MGCGSVQVDLNVPGEINTDNRQRDLAALLIPEAGNSFTFLCLGKVDLKSCDFGPLPSPTAKITGDKNCESIQFDPESDSNWICSRIRDLGSLVPVVCALLAIKGATWARWSQLAISLATWDPKCRVGAFRLALAGWTLGPVWLLGEISKLAG